jgi:hypothetical protein
MELSMRDFISQLWELGLKSPLAFEQILSEILPKKKTFLVRDFYKAVKALRVGLSLNTNFENQEGQLRLEVEDTSLDQLIEWMVVGKYWLPIDQKRYSTTDVEKHIAYIRKLREKKTEGVSSNSDIFQTPTIPDDSDTDMSDNESVFNRLFDSIKDENQSMFQQSFVRRLDGEQHILTTPPEKQSSGYLVKLELTDIGDILNIRESERWKKVARKSIFIIKNKDDKKFTMVRKLFNTVLRDMVKIRGLKREDKKILFK